MNEVPKWLDDVFKQLELAKADRDEARKMVKVLDKEITELKAARDSKDEVLMREKAVLQTRLNIIGRVVTCDPYCLDEDTYL